MSGFRRGDDKDVALLLITLLVPAGLLLLMVAMERIEGTLRAGDVTAQVEKFLGSARPEELEEFVQEGFAADVDRYWSRGR